MENLTFFILGASLTSLCFLIYIKRKKKTRGRKIIFHALGEPPKQEDLVTKSYVESQIKKGKGGIYQ
jgi:LPXTG-motif cell wall-anchored protein